MKKLFDRWINRTIGKEIEPYIRPGKGAEGRSVVSVKVWSGELDQNKLNNLEAIVRDCAYNTEVVILIKLFTAFNLADPENRSSYSVVVTDEKNPPILLEILKGENNYYYISALSNIPGKIIARLRKQNRVLQKQ